MSNLAQGSSEWLEWRTQGIGSSDVASIMGVNKYKTVRELWLDKTKRAEPFKGNEFTERGSRLEKFARDLYEWDYGVEMVPHTFVHPVYPFIRASCDGFNKEKNYGIEIKCPMKVKDPHLVDRIYYPQLQWIMLASQSKLMDFIKFDGNQKIYVIRVNANEKYQRRMIRYAKWFWHKVVNDIDPKNRKPSFIQIDDELVSKI